MRRSGIRGGGGGSGGEAGAAGSTDDAAGIAGTAGDAGAAPPDTDGPGPGDERGSGQRPRRTWRRVLVWTSGAMAVLLIAVSVAGYFYIRHLNGNIERDELHLGDDPLERAEPNAEGQTPLNILLLGSDSRDGEENQDLGGARDLAGGPVRADVQMLLHVAADRSNMTLISIPRDTQVAIPECQDTDTGQRYPAEQSASINTSLSHGGPGCTVATWEALTGIPIDHFMLVDFAGVVDMADAVGGVPVCVDANIHDPDSGLRLAEGESIVEGEQALQWLRTRHGFEDGSDIGRTRAQQMYLVNLAEELQASASLTNTRELMNLAEAATSALTVDYELGSVDALYDLGQELSEVPSDRTNTMTMPWLPDPANPAHVIPHPRLAGDLFSLVRQDIPLDDPEAVPPGGAGEGDAGEGDGGRGSDPGESGSPAPPAGETEVAVRNGTGSTTLPPVNGRAAAITSELHRLGYTSAFTDTTPSAEAATVVLYPDDADRAAAESLAEALGLPAEAVQHSPASERLTLIIGADWREGTSYPDGGQGASGGQDDSVGDAPQDNPFDEDDFLSGEDDDACMRVNSAYVW